MSTNKPFWDETPMPWHGTPEELQAFNSYFEKWLERDIRHGHFLPPKNQESRRWNALFVKSERLNLYRKALDALNEKIRDHEETLKFIEANRDNF